MFKHLLPWHVSPSGQDALFCSHFVSCTGHSEGQIAGVQTTLGSEWMAAPFIVRNSSGSRVDWSGQSGQRTCWPYLVVVFISSSVFPGHLPTPPHSLIWSITDYLLADWGCLVDLTPHHFSSNANNIIFITVPSMACLDSRPRSVFPRFLLILLVVCQWWDKKLIWKKIDLEKINDIQNMRYTAKCH